MPLFAIEISDQVEYHNLDSTPDALKRILEQGAVFDPTTDRLVRFFIAAREIDTTGKDISRKRLRAKDLRQVNRVLVQAAIDPPQVALLGTYPASRRHSGETDDSFAGERILELNVSNFFKLKLKGRSKNEVRKNTYAIIASRTDRFMQWVFLDPYQENLAQGLYVLLKLPKDLEASACSILCYCAFMKDGKHIEKRKKRIAFPG